MSEIESARPPMAGAALTILLLADLAEPSGRDLLAAWESCLAQGKREYEILVIGPAADVNTAEHPCLRVLKSSGPPGLGTAIGAGLAAARHPLFAWASGDPRYRPEELKGLLERIDHVDLVVGCRKQPMPSVLCWAGRFFRGTVRVLTGIPLDPLPTWLGWKNWLFHLLLRIGTGVRLHDVNCGLQLFRRAAIGNVPVQATGPFAPAEIIAKANFLGCLMDELPIAGPAEEQLLRPLLAEGYRVLAHADFGRR